MEVEVGRDGDGNGHNENHSDEEGGMLMRVGWSAGAFATSSLALAEPAHAGDKQKELEFTLDGIIDTAAPCVSTLGISGLTGVATAMTVKAVARSTMYALGGIAILLQCLQYKGFITINWEEMEKQGKALLDINNDGQTNADDFKFLHRKALSVLSTGLPSAAGFYAGFTLGLKL